jgi:5-methylcytosine-specific restriction endonuclease McrA
MTSQAFLLKTKAEKWVARATAAHGGYYDYSKVEYIDKRTKVVIVCPNHGDFLQAPEDHLRARRNMSGYMGCRKCGKAASLDSPTTKQKKVLCIFCGVWVRYGGNSSRAVCESPECQLSRALDSQAHTTHVWASAIPGMLRQLKEKERRRSLVGWDKWVKVHAPLLNQRKKMFKRPATYREEATWDRSLRRCLSITKRSVLDFQASAWRIRVRGMQASLNKRGQTGGIVTKRQLFNLLESQQYKCAITGDQLTPENCSADHIVPVSRGGSFDITNIQLVTKSANRWKSTMTHDEMIELAKRIVEHASSTKTI